MDGRIVFLVSVALLLLASGCLDQARPGQPEIRETTQSWGEVNESTTEIETRFTFHNPNPVGIPLKDVRTELYLGDVRAGEGSAEKSEIAPSSNSTVVISTNLDNQKIPDWWVDHVRNDEQSTMRVEGRLLFDLRLTEFEYPISRSNPIETDVLKGMDTDRPRTHGIGPSSITVMSVESEWGNVTDETTEIVTHAVVRNDNPVPLPIVSVRHSVDMNDVSVADGSSDVSTVIEPNSQKRLTFTMHIDNSKLDEWWVTHVRNDERTDVEISVEPVVELGGEESGFELAGRSSTLTTDLLG